MFTERIFVFHKKYRLEVLVLPLFFVSFFISSQSACGQTTLNLEATWRAPTTNVDGKPLTDLASFNLYRTDRGTRTRINPLPIPKTYGTAASPYPFSVVVSGVGTLTFYATAVDTSGMESAPSNRASYPYNYALPIITSLSPPSGTVGTVVIIGGKYFSPTQGSSTVSFGGTPVTIYKSWSDTTIKCTVPAGLSAGPVAVIVTTTVEASNKKNFTVK